MSILSTPQKNLGKNEDQMDNKSMQCNSQCNAIVKDEPVGEDFDEDIGEDVELEVVQPNKRTKTNN